MTTANDACPKCGADTTLSRCVSPFLQQTDECRIRQLENAIKTHRDQKADDRCIEDDDRLYEALGDGVKCDRRVGDQCAMLANCKRFIENRTEGGGWPTYAAIVAMLFKCGRHAPDCATALNHPDDGFERADYFPCTCGWDDIRDMLWPMIPVDESAPLANTTAETAEKTEQSD